MNDFKKQTIKKLAAKGIRVHGTCILPDYTNSLPYANGSRGYQVDDNGTGKVWTFSEVLEASK